MHLCNKKTNVSSLMERMLMSARVSDTRSNTNEFRLLHYMYGLKSSDIGKLSVFLCILGRIVFEKIIILDRISQILFLLLLYLRTWGMWHGADATIATISTQSNNNNNKYLYQYFGDLNGTL